MKTSAHKRAQRKAAGKRGYTEVPLKGGKRLDALTKSRKKATEVEMSGTRNRLEQAAHRLKIIGTKQKVLQVPQEDMKKAASAMRTKRVKGTVKNMSGTKRRSVRSSVRR